jgi:NCAIR mutase (PurE)-related protein
MNRPWSLFTDLERALSEAPHVEDVDVRVDPNRASRAGIPEVVLAGTKLTADVVSALQRLVDANGRAMASRCRAEDMAAIEHHFAANHEIHQLHTTVTVSKPGSDAPTGNGRVGLLTAGSSDSVVAAEAGMMLREMGVDVFQARDVGVAGLHRLVGPLRMLAEADVDAIIVAAGMDGALPSVVAGLVPVAVIGLPVSTGYGLGGNGEAALYSMLQSCAPGLSVVNIDNGIGAAASAGLIAIRSASARKSVIAPSI